MKVGDTVKLKPAMWQGIKPESYGLSFTGEYVVKRSDPDQKYPSIQIEGSAAVWDGGAFQLVKERNTMLVVGDVVKIKSCGWGFCDGDLGKTVKITGTGQYFDRIGYEVEAYNCNLETQVWGCVGPQSFGNNPEVIFNLFSGPEEEKSIERPILEERKKDKIRMELVDQGFPLALLELAKVMTWANNNKGYKDHDWKNIPDAENAFKGAAARHRVKFDGQRSFGSEMLDCTDEESGIIHLAHECFNTLALLELALAGKVK
ncbi:MAG: hypothetical protein [Myoviridae sp. ctThM1]|nr:MAG: hypothetical protein [Myoviridae sp. ctThM1]